jgi:hypothetical protein
MLLGRKITAIGPASHIEVRGRFLLPFAVVTPPWRSR